MLSKKSLKSTKSKKSSKKSHKLKSRKDIKKTIYYFYADYCGYCKRFNPLFNKLKRKYRKNINLKKIDGKKPENQKLMKYYGIKLFPTLIVKETKKPYIGDRNEKDLSKYIKSSF